MFKDCKKKFKKENFGRAERTNLTINKSFLPLVTIVLRYNVSIISDDASKLAKITKIVPN